MADSDQSHLPLSYDIHQYFLFPGFTDVHVHLREPGFSYKETIAAGTKAAAHGGYTGVCTMPNLSPAPDSLEHLSIQQDIIRQTASVHVYPYGTITKGQEGVELSDMDALAPYVVGFSDDGRGVQNNEVMFSAMKEAKRLHKPIVAHCEDNSLLHGGYIHQGAYARAHGHAGISSESEWKQIERDIALVEKTGCTYHVCHISCKESVQLIRDAKRRGLDISCETAPHYLVLDDSCLKEEGRFKMNPPLRSPEDREALIEGINDGTIDMIATDHAPHAESEKSLGLKGSMNGIVGLETAFPVLFTELVRKQRLSLEQLIHLLSIAPTERFSLPTSSNILQNYTLFDLGEKYTINSDDFLSLGKSSPFDHLEVYGKCLLTVCDNTIVWKDDRLNTTKEV